MVTATVTQEYVRAIRARMRHGEGPFAALGVQVEGEDLHASLDLVAGEIRERRDQARHPHYKAPELLATAPNQVWSWDITKLLGPVKWSYFYLYVILDIFSR